METIEINVEKIMADIREEIKSKGLTNDLLSFEEVQVEPDKISVGKYNSLQFQRELMVVNQLWNVQFYRPISGNPIKVFFKKAIRKMVAFAIKPVVEEQDHFNAAAVRVMNQTDSFQEDMQKTIRELTERITILEKENQELKLQKR